VSGTLVNLAVVRLQDGQGNLVQASPSLPVIGWDDHLYYNRYPNDLMSGGTVYGQHSAYAWNRIAGQRPVCGNYNAPCNIGEFLNDLPGRSVVEIRDENEFPLAGVKIDVYRSGPLSIWYGKIFLDEPDAVYVTDEQGRADLRQSLFDGAITHTFGHSNAVVLLKISSNGESIYRFFEVTQANEAYWLGNQVEALYVIDTQLSRGVYLYRAFLPIVLENLMAEQ
jgi:hypothetical protein